MYAGIVLLTFELLDCLFHEALVCVLFSFQRTSYLYITGIARFLQRKILWPLFSLFY